LADKQAEAHERLEQVKAYVVAASRQLEHQRSQLGVLLEWCRIRQLSLIGQLRSGFCAHSCLDQLADAAFRAAAVLRWEPELRSLQGGAYWLTGICGVCARPLPGATAHAWQLH
jgi:hypothetical protein